MNTIETKPTEISLQLKKFIRAKRERVFAAWTQPELMKRWYAPGPMTVPSASADPRIGGAYRVEMKKTAEGGGCGDHGDCGDSIVSGRYTKIVPNELLVFTWRWENGPAAPDTVVTIQLKDVPGGTELTLTHERFSSEESRDKHQHGWTGCLENLAALAERGGLPS